MPIATLATKTVAIFNGMPVIPMKPYNITIVAIIGSPANIPSFKDLNMILIMVITKTTAIKTLPIWLLTKLLSICTFTYGIPVISTV